uniref:Putative DNA polymerase zeta catalytic subunit isoform X4 n=1 Tax=Davidia involucrata TaxID=16924 RepID=A0A5B7BVI4_DAVIN
MESGSISEVKPIVDGLNQQPHGKFNAQINPFHKEVTTRLQNERNIIEVKECRDRSQDISQISAPDGKSKPTPLSQIGFRDPVSVGGGQQLTLFSIEVCQGTYFYSLCWQCLG